MNDSPWQRVYLPSTLTIVLEIDVVRLEPAGVGIIVVVERVGCRLPRAPRAVPARRVVAQSVSGSAQHVGRRITRGREIRNWCYSDGRYGRVLGLLEMVMVMVVNCRIRCRDGAGCHVENVLHVKTTVRLESIHRQLGVHLKHIVQFTHRGMIDSCILPHVN